MPLPTVVFLEIDSLPKRISIPLISEPHQLKTYSQTSPEQVIERLQGATVVVVNKIILNERILSQCPDIKLIALAATGVNNIDTEYCKAKGITVKNVTGYAKTTVAEHTLMMILALQRSLNAYRQQVINGDWGKSSLFYLGDNEIVDLNGLTLGIIGKGAIGERVADLGKAFGMHVQFLGRKEQKAEEGKIPFEKGLETSDIISIHCPLTPQTQDLISHKELKKMKKTALLINTARGGIIDETALVEAINNKEIKGAALDVVSTEPLPENHPLTTIAANPNIIITPHCSWLSDDALSKLTTQMIDNINTFLSADV
jgi:glycerate dehydrogenase